LNDFDTINIPAGYFGNIVQAAALGGHGPLLALILARGGDPNSEGRYGSALRAASLGGHNGAVHLLLRSGARIQERSRNALEAAAFNGHVSTVNILRSSDKDVNWETLASAAIAAAYRGHDEIFRQLLPKLGKYTLDAALATALRGGQCSTAELILRHIRNIVDENSEDAYIDMEACPGRWDMLPSTKKQTPPNTLVQASDKTAGQREHFLSLQLSKMDDLKTADSMSKLLTDYAREYQGKGKYLRLAARYCGKSIMQDLLDRGLDINSTGDKKGYNSEQHTPIEVSALAGNLDTFQTLLHHGARMEKALQMAIAMGRESIVHFIISQDPDFEVDFEVDPKTYHDRYFVKHPWVEDRGTSADSPLALAIEWDREDLGFTLLAHKSKSSNPSLGLSFIVAARRGKTELVKSMLKTCVVESKDDFLQIQAIREAARNEHLSCIEAILANSDFGTERQQILADSLQEAVGNRRYGSIHELRNIGGEKLTEYLAGITLVALAGKELEYGEEMPIEEFKKVRAEFTAFGGKLSNFEPYQRQALKKSLKSENDAITLLILEKTTRTDFLREEKAILSLAVQGKRDLMFRWHNERSSSQDVCKRLIHLGADINEVDEKGNTALYYTCLFGLPKTFQLLVDSGANYFTTHSPRANPDVDTGHTDNSEDPVNLLKVALDANLQSKHGPPIIWHRFAKETAAKWGDILMFCLNAGLSFSPNDSAMIRILHESCFVGSLLYVQTIVSKGVDLNGRAGRSNGRDYDRGTALHAAVVGGQKDVAIYLIEAGADPRRKAQYTVEICGERFDTPIKAALQQFPRREV
jgi:ankyrin repeat protein